MMLLRLAKRFGPSPRAFSPIASARPRVDATASASTSTSSSSPPSSSLEVGNVFTERRAFTAEDVLMFASVTNDANPIHVDGAGAAAAGFAGGAVVHGMLVASMFGGVIGTRFPGAVYASQTLTFRAPVTVGERVLAEVEVTRVGESRVAFATRVRKEGEGGELAVDGTAMAFMRDAGARGGE